MRFHGVVGNRLPGRVREPINNFFYCPRKLLKDWPLTEKGSLLKGNKSLGVLFDEALQDLLSIL